MRPLVMGLTLVAAVGAMTADAQAQVNSQSTQMTGASRVGQHAGNANGQTTDTTVKANDKAYNAALKNLPDKQYDPWRGVR
ncbi:MAG: hypothetical protein WBW06_03350 [Xanthobacteraceae bacterium]|jgi:hypothetical protein